MNSVHTAFNRGNRIDNTQATVLMAVPVESNLFSLLKNDLSDEPGNRTGAVRSRMSYGIGNSQPGRTTLDRGREQRSNYCRTRTRRVFGRKQEGHSLFNTEFDGALRHFQ